MAWGPLAGAAVAAAAATIAASEVGAVWMVVPSDAIDATLSWACRPWSLPDCEPPAKPRGEGWFGTLKTAAAAAAVGWCAGGAVRDMTVTVASGGGATDAAVPAVSEGVGVVGWG